MALFGSKTNTDDKKKVASKAVVAKDDKSKEAKEAASMKDLYAEAPVKTGTTKSKTVASKYTASNRFLVRPVITEKATDLSADNKYAFVVEKSANKIEVAKAIKAVYGVEPKAVNMINMQGKKVARGRIRGQRKDWKKAIVTLKKGDTISIYEGV